MKQNTKSQISLKTVFGDKSRIGYEEYGMQKGPALMWGDVNVTYYEQPLEITAKEKQVLGLLILAQGTLLSTEQLVQAFLEQNINSSLLIIRNSISQLRGKIDKQHPALPLAGIHHTVEEPEGYKLIPGPRISLPPPLVGQDRIHFGQFEMTKPNNRPWSHGTMIVEGKTVRLQPQQKSLMAALIQKQGGKLTSVELKEIFPATVAHSKKVGAKLRWGIFKAQICDIQNRIKRDTGQKEIRHLITPTYSGTFPTHRLLDI